MDNWKDMVLAVLVSVFSVIGLITTFYMILSALGVYG